MNEKTMNQIKAMKEQTIGVEIEMNHITRRRAAHIAADFFGTGRFEYTTSRNGYDTWSAWDQTGREWKFSKDVSIAGREDCKTELVTPILTYADIETLQELIRRLRKAGAISNPNEGCGVHIHIGANGHDPKTIRNLVNIMAGHEDILSKAINIDRHRKARYCQTVDTRFLERINREKPGTMADLADAWYESQDENWGRTHHYNGSRYHMLNLHATFTKGTIEFRMFQFDNPTDERKGGLHAGQLKAYIQICLAMSAMAKTTSRASAKKNQEENEKFAMRTWMNRLGMIGEEFATAREILTKRLNGDAAFRFGRAA